jgi:RimJ/RimL family protein N-acetyltransferase
MLIGSRVKLRAIGPADYPLLAAWHNDPAVMKHWGRPGNTMSLEQITRREEFEASRDNSQKYIVETTEEVPIGQIDYYDLDWQARSTWVSILIGDPAYWGGGFGTDAMRVLLTYLFDQLGLHRVSLTVHEENERAQRSYRKNGFVPEGTLRDWAFYDGRWVNGLLMSVLESDFRATAGEH